MSSSSGRLLRDHGLSTPPKYAEPCAIGSAQGLARWLNTRMISTCLNMWGIEPGTKHVTNLWVELAEGEITLEDSCPPKRTVNVVSVNIRNKSGQVLLESHQEMGDGSNRVKNRPLSQKMKAGETVEEACRRGICEELGLVLGSPDKIELLMDSYEEDVEERDSLSYPGLLTCYVVHKVLLRRYITLPLKFDISANIVKTNNTITLRLKCKRSHYTLNVEGRRG